MYDPVDSPKFPEHLVVYTLSLKCAKKGCGFPVVLVAPVKKEVRESDLLARILRDLNLQGAVCAQGFPPASPYRYAGLVRV